MSLMRKFGFAVPNVGAMAVNSIRSDPGVAALARAKSMILTSVKSKQKQKKVKTTPDTDPAFASYAAAVNERLDSMIDILAGLGGISGREVEEKSNVVSDREESRERTRGPNFLSFLGGLIGIAAWKFLISPLIRAIGQIVRFFSNLIRNFVKWLDDVIKSIQRTLSRIISSVRGIFTRISRLFSQTIPRLLNSFYQNLRNGFKSALERLSSVLERMIVNPLARMLRSASGAVRSGFRAIGNGFRALGNRVSSMWDRTGARAAQRVISINRLGSLGTFFRTLGAIGRRIPVISAIIIPIIEKIESDQEIKALADRRDAGEITEEQFRQRASESGVGAVMDSLGIILGSSAGAILGSLLGPVGTFAGGVLGGVGGSMLSDWLKPMIAPPLARALIAGEDEAVQLAQGLGENIQRFQEMMTPEFFIERVRSINPAIANTISEFMHQEPPQRAAASTPTRAAPTAVPGTAIVEEQTTTHSTNVVVDASSRTIINTHEEIIPSYAHDGAPNVAAGYS